MQTRGGQANVACLDCIVVCELGAHATAVLYLSLLVLEKKKSVFSKMYFLDLILALFFPHIA